MTPFKADLHTHTYFSDGSDSPEELLLKAKECGLSGIAITDHDTVEAYSEAIELAKKIGISLLVGVEFSAYHKKEPVHILGYAFSLKSDLIHTFCLKHQKRRQERNQKILENLKRLGIVITAEELEKIGRDLPGRMQRTIGRPHIAQVLVKREVVSSIKEAFQKYLGEGKVAYDPGEKISIQDTIEVIHQAKGKAVIAHPHLLIRKTVIKELLTFPFDGLEGYYAVISKAEESKWIDIGRAKKWLITGGSDYHGTIKPQNPLGSSWVDQQTFDSLYAVSQANN